MLNGVVIDDMTAFDQQTTGAILYKCVFDKHVFISLHFPPGKACPTALAHKHRDMMKKTPVTAD
jgi:hypothetical protein